MSSFARVCFYAGALHSLFKFFFVCCRLDLSLLSCGLGLGCSRFGTLARLGAPRVVGNLRRPPKTCHSSSESWENGDSEYVIRYAGKIRPCLKFQYLHNIRNYFFWPDLRRLPSQQTSNIWYVLVANMLESNPVVRNISEIHLRLHKFRCIPILTLHIQHGSHSPPPAASL